MPAGTPEPRPSGGTFRRDPTARAAAWLRVLLFCALSLLASGASARAALALDDPAQAVPLLDWGDAWLDGTGRASAQEVAALPASAWAPTEAGRVYSLPRGAAVWIRFTVPPAPDTERWYVELASPAIDRASLFTLDAQGRWNEQSAGDAVPVTQWPVPHRHPLLPLTMSAEEPRRYLLRVQTPRLFGTPIVFVSESRLARSEQRMALMLGMYFGLAALAAVLAALNAVSLRSGAYAATALAVIAMGLAQASATGVAGLVLWPQAPVWNDKAAVVLPVLAAATAAWCFVQLLTLAGRSRDASRGFGAIALLGVPAAAALMWMPSHMRHLIVVPYVVFCGLTALFASAWAAHRGDPHGRWVALASLPVACGAALAIARTLGLVAATPWTKHGLLVGTAIQWPMLLFVLMRRSQQRRESRRRVHEIGRVDPATGLVNGGEFTARMRRMLARSRRLDYHSAVLLVDIVNMEQLKRDYDEHWAEEIPVRVAHRLQSTARDIDTVARLSERRFGLLIEGPLDDREAAEIGSRIVARCLMPFKGKPVKWVPRVRVAQAIVRDGSPDELIRRMHDMLAGQSPDTTRAVFSLPAA